MPPCAYTNGYGAIMTLKIENLGVIERAVKQRMEKLKPVFKEALGVEKERIKTRTQSGQSVDGKPFSKYSRKWAKVRKQAGLQTAYVDLTYSGDMFKAMKASFTADEASITGVISFDGKDEAKKAIENEMLGRSFFGLTDEQIEIIKNKLRNVT